jgi:hypothetical protein
MWHNNRVFCLTPVSTADKLAAMLVHHTWCRCAGFQLETAPDTLFLNDSTSPDGAQEYAILRNLNGVWYQVDSITFGWIKSIAKASMYIRDAVAGVSDEFASVWGLAEPRFHEPDQPCAFCR